LIKKSNNNKTPTKDWLQYPQINVFDMAHEVFESPGNQKNYASIFLAA